MNDIVISARNLSKHYHLGGGLGASGQVVRAVDGVSLDIRER